MEKACHAMMIFSSMGHLYG